MHAPGGLYGCVRACVLSVACLCTHPDVDRSTQKGLVDSHPSQFKIKTIHTLSIHPSGMLLDLGVSSHQLDEASRVRTYTHTNRRPFGRLPPPPP